MTERPPDSWVANVVLYAATETEAILAREVQASRKLVADLLALAPKNPVGLFDWYGGYDYGWNEALEDVRALIEASGCSADT